MSFKIQTYWFLSCIQRCALSKTTLNSPPVYLSLCVCVRTRARACVCVEYVHYFSF